MKIKNLISLVVLLITTLACGLSGISVTGPPVSATISTTTAMPEPLALKSNPFSEDGQAPNYKITAEIPYLDPSTDPSLQAYNATLKSIVDGVIEAFKGSLAEMPATPIQDGSSLDIQYQLIGQKGSFWSIQFNIMRYADGAAHPYHYSISSNYDLKSGKALTLEDVFLPNSNYLQVISDLCKAELSARDIAFDSFQTGADPLAENYQRWNVSNEGFLVITFDEYQVAAYAAGPQVVVIPFSTLQSIQNPDGILGVFAQ